MTTSNHAVKAREACLTHPISANLTARQRFVLRGLIAGHSNLEMAEQLCLTEYTIKYHCRALYQHFGVANRVELVSELLRRFGSDLLAFAQTEEQGQSRSTRASCNRVRSVADRRPRGYARPSQPRGFTAHSQYLGQRL
ncbi:MAG: LuxR C-terminal-related transcriptional regulator [Natronospirillum sp.]|uniref:response regulator transcription factor n=1 Tax=Natronospirillum sp. TaxID=2812955 RepID=UPI0025EFA76A|nr:LuxR C-terminal-related transcriptional regulator [Natronospirillum sp.]MCH8550541.1 LuxR C-terminal-related transcriptional regulator [Natronospirillum sp.]